MAVRGTKTERQFRRRGLRWPAVLWCSVSRSSRRGDGRKGSRCLYSAQVIPLEQSRNYFGGRVKYCAGSLLSQNLINIHSSRAAVNENEQAASSTRPRYEARHMSSAAMVGRAARAGRRQPNSSNAAQRRSCAIRLAVRLIRGTAPKGAKMFAASDMTSRCEAQSSRLVPSRTTRHLRGPLAVGRSRELAPRPPTVSCSSNHGELHVAFSEWRGLC